MADSSDLLSICMDCKHPLTDKGDPVKTITISGPPEALGVPISHGLCSECVILRREELARFKAEKKKGTK